MTWGPDQIGLDFRHDSVPERLAGYLKIYLCNGYQIERGVVKAGMKLWVMKLCREFVGGIILINTLPFNLIWHNTCYSLLK
jgi:hypothetical protein